MCWVITIYIDYFCQYFLTRQRMHYSLVHQLNECNVTLNSTVSEMRGKHPSFCDMSESSELPVPFPAHTLDACMLGVVAHPHYTGLGLGQGLGTDAFLYYAMYCQHYTGTVCSSGSKGARRPWPPWPCKNKSQRR